MRADMLLSLAVKLFKVKWSMITILTPRRGYFIAAAEGLLPCLRGTVVRLSAGCELRCSCSELSASRML